MTRNWCNQNQSLALETKMGKNQNYIMLVDIIEGEHTVNRMGSSFPVGGHTDTYVPKPNLISSRHIEDEKAQKLTSKQALLRTTSDVPHWDGQ